LLSRLLSKDWVGGRGMLISISATKNDKFVTVIRNYASPKQFTFLSWLAFHSSLAPTFSFSLLVLGHITTFCQEQRKGGFRQEKERNKKEGKEKAGEKGR